MAIVGYTNAGKSTLLNHLTDAEVLEEDKLFATLDPTTRMLDASPEARAADVDAAFGDPVGDHVVRALVDVDLDLRVIAAVLIEDARA